MDTQVRQHPETITHRVITMLDRKQMEFLDKLGKDALFTTRHKLSYNDIIKALIDFAMEINLSAENVKSEKDLKEKIKEAMKRSGCLASGQGGSR